MRCPKCNTELKSTAKFCSKCGKQVIEQNDHLKQYNYSKEYSNYTEKNNDNHYDQYSYSSKYSKTAQYKITSDEDYIKNYIGDNYETIKKEKFSLAGFVFGPFYLLYRKIWSFLLLFILIICIVYYVDITMVPATYAILSFFIGIKINNIFINYASRKVDEIKISNPDKTSNEIYDICGKKGKPLKIGIILLLIFYISTIIYFIYIPYKTQTTKPVVREQKTETKTNNKIRNLNYTISDDFKTDSVNNYPYKYYKYNDSSNNCSIAIDSDILHNKEIEEYISENTYLNQDDTTLKIESKTINNNIFKYLKVTSNSYDREIYYINDSTYIYRIELSKKVQYENNICEQELNNIINSIEIIEE